VQIFTVTIYNFRMRERAAGWTPLTYSNRWAWYG